MFKIDNGYQGLPMHIGRFVLLLSLSLLPIYPSIAMVQPVSAQHSMVVSEQQVASQIGADILQAGGNAVDAAVAVGYALAVSYPCCGNIGGGGFMTIHLANGKNIFLNFREKAPRKATANMFATMNQGSTYGYLAVAVPGSVLGLDTALSKYGSMTRKQVLAPAIRLAREGYIVSPYDAQMFNNYAQVFRQQPTVAAIFLKDGRPYHAGDRLIQRDLAKTLQLISDHGPVAFYKGPIADAIVQASKTNGGILSKEDFATYTMQELRPLQCRYRGYTILSAPPPSSGGVTLCEMLNILENYSLKALGYHSAQSIRVIVEAMRYGFTDRNTKLGDPDFINNPVAQLIDKHYAAELSTKINSSTRDQPATATVQRELTDTTHYSVIDRSGNAVAVTTTINGFFGAEVIANPTGFFLNNEMDDFTTVPGKENKFSLVQGTRNTIQAGKRPLSSMTPTIVMKNGKIFMVIGSPGGPRIITSILLTLLNVIDYGMNIQAAVNAPRFHFQGLPDTIDAEPFSISFLARQQLKLNGYDVNPQHTWAAVEAILIDPVTGTIYGANDNRRGNGAAIGN